MNLFSKIGGLLKSSTKPEKTRQPARKKSAVKSPASKKTSSMILEKSFLQKRFVKPEVVSDTYTDSEWIFAAIDKISTSVSKVPIRLYRGERNGQKTEVTNHLALRALNKPNPHQTGNDLRVFTQMNLELWGKGYWFLGKGSLTGIPKEIWPLKSSEVSNRFDANGDLVGYRISRWGFSMNVGLDEIVVFKQNSPNSIYEGESAAKACARSVQADGNTLKYVEAFFENSARPDFIISVAGINDEQAEKLEEKWKHKHRGVEKSNKPAIIDGEFHIEKLTGSLKDLDITEQSRERRDRILAAFGVPKAVLGMVDDVNRASMEGSKLVYSEFTVDPRLQEFVEKLNAFYLPKFPGTERMFFEADEHIPRDNELLLREVESGLNSGYLTINEARARQGYNPIKGGDQLLVSFGRVPLAQLLAAPADTAPVKSLEDVVVLEKSKQSLAESEAAFLRVHERNEKRFVAVVGELFDKQKREVLGNIKKGMRKDALNPVDEQRWLREFIDSSIPLYSVMIQDGGALGASAVAALTSRSAKFSPRIPAVINEIARMATVFARHVNETTKESLRESLMAGVAAGEGEAVLADRVDEVFKIRKGNASTIARTETTRAINFGQIEGYRQNGINKKQWLTVLDEDTREGHAQANLQVRGLDEPFLVGGERLKTPGDPSGTPKNTINCRCRVLPVI